MSKYKSRHKLKKKTMAIVIACLFFVNNIAWASSFRGKQLDFLNVWSNFCRTDKTEAVPASILQGHPDVTVILDEEAASNYEKKKKADLTAKTESEPVSRRKLLREKNTKDTEFEIGLESLPYLGEYKQLKSGVTALLSSNELLCYAKISQEPFTLDLQELLTAGKLEVALVRRENEWILIKGYCLPPLVGVFMPTDREFGMHYHPNPGYFSDDKNLERFIREKGSDFYAYPADSEELKAKAAGIIDFIISDKGICAYGANLDMPILFTWKELALRTESITELHKCVIDLSEAKNVKQTGSGQFEILTKKIFLCRTIEKWASFGVLGFPHDWTGEGILPEPGKLYKILEIDGAKEIRIPLSDGRVIRFCDISANPHPDCTSSVILGPYVRKEILRLGTALNVSKGLDSSSDLQKTYSNLRELLLDNRDILSVIPALVNLRMVPDINPRTGVPYHPSDFFGVVEKSVKPDQALLISDIENLIEKYAKGLINKDSDLEFNLKNSIAGSFMYGKEVSPIQLQRMNFQQWEDQLRYIILNPIYENVLKEKGALCVLSGPSSTGTAHFDFEQNQHYCAAEVTLRLWNRFVRFENMEQFVRYALKHMAYRNAGGTREKGPHPRCRPGDIIVYYNRSDDTNEIEPKHTGIITKVTQDGKPVEVWSKLALYGVFVHSVNLDDLFNAGYDVLQRQGRLEGKKITINELIDAEGDTLFFQDSYAFRLRRNRLYFLNKLVSAVYRTREIMELINDYYPASISFRELDSDRDISSAITCMSKVLDGLDGFTESILNDMPGIDDMKMEISLVTRWLRNTLDSEVVECLKDLKADLKANGFTGREFDYYLDGVMKILGTFKLILRVNKLSISSDEKFILPDSFDERFTLFDRIAVLDKILAQQKKEKDSGQFSGTEKKKTNAVSAAELPALDIKTETGKSVQGVFSLINALSALREGEELAIVCEDFLKMAMPELKGKMLTEFTGMSEIQNLFNDIFLENRFQAWLRTLGYKGKVKLVLCGPGKVKGEIDKILEANANSRIVTLATEESVNEVSKILPEEKYKNVYCAQLNLQDLFAAVQQGIKIDEKLYAQISELLFTIVQFAQNPERKDIYTEPQNSDVLVAVTPSNNKRIIIVTPRAVILDANQIKELYERQGGIWHSV